LIFFADPRVKLYHILFVFVNGFDELAEITVTSKAFKIIIFPQKINIFTK